MVRERKWLSGQSGILSEILIMNSIGSEKGVRVCTGTFQNGSDRTGIFRSTGEQIKDRAFIGLLQV
jgi:hypothetical protein